MIEEGGLSLDESMNLVLGLDGHHEASRGVSRLCGFQLTLIFMGRGLNYHILLDPNENVTANALCSGRDRCSHLLLGR